MSVTVQAYVWANSTMKGASLLLLVALADRADDAGISYQAISTLATKIRMTERTTQRLITTIKRSKELRVGVGQGPRGTNLYQIVMNQTLPLFAAEEGDNLSGDNLSGDNLSPPVLGGGGVTSKAQRGDTAMSPDTSVDVNLRAAGQGGKPPTPTAQLRDLYIKTVQDRYKVPPAINARVMGQLAALIKQLGEAQARAVLTFFVASNNPFYVQRRHDLGILIRDAARLDMDVKILSTTGASGTYQSPTEAQIYLIAGNGELLRQLEPVPVGDPRDIAMKAKATHGRLLAAQARRDPRYIDVRIGAKSSRYSISELTQARA